MQITIEQDLTRTFCLTRQTERGWRLDAYINNAVKAAEGLTGDATH